MTCRDLAGYLEASAFSSLGHADPSQAFYASMLLVSDVWQATISLSELSVKWQQAVAGSHLFPTANHQVKALYAARFVLSTKQTSLAEVGEINAYLHWLRYGKKGSKVSSSGNMGRLLQANCHTSYSLMAVNL